MKNFIQKSTVFLCISLITATANAENYFNVEGTKWIVETNNFYSENPVSTTTYSLEGRVEVAGHDCLKYLCDGTFLYYVYTEGDKVYCIRPNAEEESLLIYDFGMEPGDTETFDIVCRTYNDKQDPHTTQQCTDLGQITSCGHTYEVMFMREQEQEDEGYIPSQWIKGIGGIKLFNGDFANWGNEMVGAMSVLRSVEVNGETIFQKDDCVVGIKGTSAEEATVSYNLNGTVQRHSSQGLMVRNGSVIWVK